MRRRMPAQAPSAAGFQTAATRRPAETSMAMAKARALKEAGRLTEETLLETTRRGETALAMAHLALAAGLPIHALERAAAMRSAKGMVSLVWKAGYTMRAGMAVQMLLARLPPNALMGQGPGGSFPLSAEEMRWQIDFLARAGR